MRILVLNADYPGFLAWFYRRQPGLESTPYATQMAARNASLFGVANFYSKNFAALGHTAAEIHVNNPWLQAAWAREHGMATGPLEPPGVIGRKGVPAWLQRVVTPFKPILRPLARKIGMSPRLNARAEKVLLAQIEDFQARPGAQPGHLSRRHQPDATHQGYRQAHPDRPGWNCAIPRRRLVRI